MSEPKHLIFFISYSIVYATSYSNVRLGPGPLVIDYGLMVVLYSVLLVCLLRFKNYVQDLHGHCIHFVLTASSETLFFNIYFFAGTPCFRSIVYTLYTPSI